MNEDQGTTGLPSSPQRTEQAWEVTVVDGAGQPEAQELADVLRAALAPAQDTRAQAPPAADNGGLSHRGGRRRVTRCGYARDASRLAR